MQANGQCLCGNVTVHAPNLSPKLGVCHCNMCRTWVGGPFLAVEGGAGATFQGQENIGTYASSEWAERAFCKTCGTALYYRLKEPELYILSAGLFSAETPFELDYQIFIDKKPAYYNFAEQTVCKTEAEFLAEHAPQA